MHEVIQAVKALPLLGGNLFADLARIFACGVDATSDGSRIMLVEDQLLGIRTGIASPLQTFRITERSDEALPVGLRADAAGIEHEAHGHVELTYRVLSAL